MRYGQTGREIENNANFIAQQTETVNKNGRSFNFAAGIFRSGPILCCEIAFPIEKRTCGI